MMGTEEGPEPNARPPDPHPEGNLQEPITGLLHSWL